MRLAVSLFLHRLYQFFVVIGVVFVLYLLIVRAVITWVQQFPEHFFSFAEEITHSIIDVGSIEIEQSWLGVDIKLNALHLENETTRADAKELKFDFNIFSPWIPSVRYGEQLQLDGVTVDFKTLPFKQEKGSFTRNLLLKNIARKSWYSIKLADIVVNSGSEKKVQFRTKIFQSYFDDKLTFAGLSELLVEGDEKSEFQYKGRFSTTLWNTVEQGQASFSIVRPVLLSSLYTFLPEVTAKKLPKGSISGELNLEVRKGQLSNLNLATNLQNLTWRKHKKIAKLPTNLPKDIGLNLSLVTPKAKSSWVFEFEKISLDNHFVKTISPIFLELKENQQVSLSAEEFNLLAIKPIFESLVNSVGYEGMGKNIKELVLKDLEGVFDLKRGYLQTLSFAIPSLDLPQNKMMPGIKFENLYFSKQEKEVEVAINKGFELYLDYISKKPMVFLTKQPYQLITDTSKNSWQLLKTQLSVDKIPVQLEAMGDFNEYIDLRLNTQPKTVAKVKEYLPYSLMGKELEAWLKSALVKGNNVKGFMHLQGKIQDFPFDNGKGKFYAEASLDNAKLKFQPDWPAVEDFSAKLIFTPYNLSIYSKQAKLNKVNAKKIVVDINQLASENIAVNISGVAGATAENAVEFLQATPLLKNIEIDQFVANKSRISGDVVVDLKKIWVPVNGFLNEKESLTAEVNLKNVDLTLYDSILIEKINGQFLITEDSVRSKRKVKALFQNGEAFFDVGTESEIVNIKGKGVASMQNPYFTGSQDWLATLELPLKKEADITFNSDFSLKNSVSLLPAPFSGFDKLSSPNFRLSFKVKDNKEQFVAQLSNQYLAEVNFANGLETLEGFEIIATTDTGSMPLEISQKAKNSYLVHGKLGELDVDGWINLALASNVNLSDSNLYDETKWLPSSLTLDNITLLEQDLPNVKLNLYQIRREETSEIIMSAMSDDISLLASQGSDNKYTVNLNKLNLVKISDVEKTEFSCSPVQIKTSIPTIEFRGKNIKFANKHISKLNFKIKDDGKEVIADKIVAELANTKGLMTGRYAYIKENSMSELTGDIKSNNIENFLSFLGVKKGLKGEKLDLSAKVHWQGFINCFSKIKLKGKLDYKLKAGVIKDAEPGVARVLGLLSLESLARRLSLDVSDVTKAGLAFDSIEGYGRFNKGIFGLEALTLKAPSADAMVFGEINLVQEDMDLTAEITPAIGSTLPVIATISGFATPLAGLAAYALLKVIPGINEDLITYKYKLKGSFDKPELIDKGVSVDLLNAPVHEDKTSIIDLE